MSVRHSLASFSYNPSTKQCHCSLHQYSLQIHQPVMDGAVELVIFAVHGIHVSILGTIYMLNLTHPSLFLPAN